ncbi:hypothetical protein diail_12317 [Diaporthe ilicicola]|nr:hypothetical protein diail_12317 [Diaporthe ilicicola]
MVKSYMANTRTIILAVIPCNVDNTTQEILELAKIADPEGVRTMGVLTKPDLATEMATQDAVVKLVAGKGSTLKLGYYVVKNRSADDTTSTLSERASAEAAFFSAPVWSPISDRCGTPALKSRVCELLMHLTKQELPHVRSDIENSLRMYRSQLEAMGFLAVTQAALSGYYAGDKIFKSFPDLKLITKIMKLNEVFSNIFWKRGHKQHFGPSWDDEGESSFGRSIDSVPYEIPLRKYPELDGIILSDDFQCPEPSKGPIIGHIQEVFESNRGPELGTFGGTILATIFEEQSEKWELLVLSHTSNVIALVHDYIFQLLSELCPDRQTGDQLWNVVLVDKLTDAYRRAMTHARFLLDVERGGTPSTYNHYFNANLQKKRGERIAETFKNMAVSSPWGEETEKYVPLSQVGRSAIDKDNGQQQVVSYCLLEGDGSPLRALDSDLVLNLDDEQLEEIAGEDVESKNQRHILERQIESLKAALKVLRS